MRISSFVVLSVITAPHYVPTPQISKIQLKRPVKEKGRSPLRRVEAQLPPQSLKIY